MKKFLRKKPVMIAFIIAAVVFLAVEIGILVRPVSYGLNYTITETRTVMGKEHKSTQKLNIKSDRVARLTMIYEGDGEEEKTVLDYWIYRDGHNVVIIGEKKYIEATGVTKEEIEEANREDVMTKAEYEVEIERIKKMKEENSVLYAELLEDDGIKVGIFRAEFGKDANGNIEYANNVQAIIFIAVHGVFTVALITFATLSLVFFLKKRK